MNKSVFNEDQKKEFFDSLLENLIEKETNGLSFDAARDIRRDQNTINILTGMEYDIFKLYFGIGNIEKRIKKIKDLSAKLSNLQEDESKSKQPAEEVEKVETGMPVLGASLPEESEGYAMTIEEIAERFNITRERVKQIVDKACRHLEHNYRRKCLKKYLVIFQDIQNLDNDDYREATLKVLEMMKYGPDWMSKLPHEEKINLDEVFEARRKGEDIFKELIQDSLKNEKMCELKKEIGEKAYTEFLKKEIYEILKYQ